jgi:hypothetical protein
MGRSSRLSLDSVAVLLAVLDVAAGAEAADDWGAGVVPEPESVDGAACAKPLPRPRAAKPGPPSIAPEAAMFLMVLMVISSAIRMCCRSSPAVVDEGMAPSKGRHRAKDASW